MKERGILFTPENYTKSEQGSKTQTRRIMKVQPEYIRGTIAPQEIRGEPKKRPAPYFDAYDGGPYWCWWDEYNRQGNSWIKCPYGTVGDRLYVKEAHAIMSIEGSTVGVAYKNRLPKGKTLADTDGGLDLIKVDDETLRWAILKADSDRWRSPLFMPKWAARLWLEITAVRVERIQQISYDDQGAEGVRLGPECNDRLSGFIELWDSVNGVGAWKRNDWVWVLSYRKVPS